MWALLVFSTFAAVGPYSVDGFASRALCEQARVAVRAVAAENARNPPGAVTVCLKLRESSAVGSFAR